MTTALGKIRNSKTIRKLSDINQVALSGGNSTKISVVKATNHKKTPPKPKHVYVLLSVKDAVEIEKMIDQLIKIYVKSNDWIRAIKSLQVIHRLIQESKGETFVRLLSNKRGSWIEKQFQDRSSGKGMTNTQFIRAYARYIDSRSLLYHKHPHFRKLKRKDNISKYCGNITAKNPKSLFKLLQHLQNLFAELLSIKETSNELVLENGATLGAFSLVLKDSFALFTTISDGIIKLLDLIFSMNKKNASYALKIYQKHIDQTNELIDFYDFARNCQHIQADSIPKIKPQPSSLIGNIREYISNYDVKYQKRGSQDTQSIDTQPLSDILTEEELSNLPLEIDDKSSVNSSQNDLLFVTDNIPDDDSSSMFSFEEFNTSLPAPNNQQSYQPNPVYPTRYSTNNPFQQAPSLNPFQQYPQNNPFQQPIDVFDQNPLPKSPQNAPENSILDEFLGL